MAKAKYTPEYKARLVLEIFKEESTPSEIAAQEGINKNQLQNRKKEFIENSARFLAGNKAEKAAAKEVAHQAQMRENLEKKVDQLTIENDWLKRSAQLPNFHAWENSNQMLFLMQIALVHIA